MRTTAIGTRNRADVPSRCPHPKTARRERIFDAEPEGERVAGLRMEDVFHKNLVRLACNGPPAGPADEPMDGVVALWLVEWQLVAAPVELVAAILQSVGPRDQDLPTRRRAHLIGPITVKKLPAAGGVCAKPAANLDDDRPLTLGRDLNLLAGGCNHGAPHASSATSVKIPNAMISCISRTPRTFRGRASAPRPR